MAMAKVLRGGRSGSYRFQPPAIGRGVPRDGMLPALGSSSLATPTAGMGRMHSSKSSFVKDKTVKFRYVRGHFESSDSEFVMRHLNERLQRLESYRKSVRRHWLFPVLTLVGVVMMVSPMALDYYRLSKIEKAIHDLRREIAEAEVECEALGIAIHGVPSLNCSHKEGEVPE
ncbi:unnamed protein product [Urochloa humidicola]